MVRYHVGAETGISTMSSWVLHGIEGSADAALCGKAVTDMATVASDVDWERVNWSVCPACVYALDE
jgi:hypothetical protein